ncbi:MAG TPA: hypothetical protein VFQ47_04690 [Nitrososphaera sp.]|nr:hypothetical protein [Nitrososphaera sp.]
MDWSMALFLLCSVAGMVMVLGSLFLLWQGRIYLDTEGKTVSEISLPLGIKFGTQFPVLIMFLFGVFMLIFPVYYAKNICPNLPLHAKTFPEMVKVSGRVKTLTPIDVYAVIAEQPMTNNDVIFNLPFVKNAPYRIMYSDKKGNIGPIVTFSLDDPKPYEFRETQVETTSSPGLEISKQAETVPPDVVNAYK